MEIENEIDGRVEALVAVVMTMRLLSMEATIATTNVPSLKLRFINFSFKSASVQTIAKLIHSCTQHHWFSIFRNICVWNELLRRTSITTDNFALWHSCVQ